MQDLLHLDEKLKPFCSNNGKVYFSTVFELVNGG